MCGANLGAVGGQIVAFSSLVSFREVARRFVGSLDQRQIWLNKIHYPGLQVPICSPDSFAHVVPSLACQTAHKQHTSHSARHPHLSF